MKKDNFKRPGNECRPIKLKHDYSFKGTEDRKERDAVIDRELAFIKEIGYGGVTMNSTFGHYLQKTGWEDYEHAVKYALENDLRMWIYDEKGYPSGTAGGETLKDHPEYESKGLVSLFRKVTAGEKVRIRKPKYHEELFAAYAYRVLGKTKPDSERIYSKEDDLLIDGFTGAAVDLMKYSTKEGGLSWTAGEGFADAKEGDTFAVCCYWTKKLYENTHACQNFHEQRRYLSVINEKAVGEFINNTYAQYKKRVGKYLGKQIEAFFTDEPSLMAGYLDGTVHPPKDRVKDEPHLDFPLLPVVQWETFLPDEFRNRYGYGLADNLHYLYAGTSPRAVKVRHDYNLMIAQLYENAFYGQIEKYCHSIGIDFSGHVLMEEYLLHHGIWEGNIFRIMSHMDIPGIDVLTTMPDSLINMSVTPKLVSSAAAWFGKKGTMAEVSAFEEQNFKKIPFGLAEMKGSAATQFVMGVDVFQSYFGENALNKEEYNEYCDYVARIGEAFKGGKNGADIILCYPIEGVIAGAKGSGKFREVREYSQSELRCEESWNGLTKLLLRNKLDFVMADEKAIEDLYVAEDEEGIALINMITDSCYKAIVVPSLVAADSRFIERLADFASNGITVIFDSLSINLPSVCEDGDLRENIAELLSMENVINVADYREIPEILKERFMPQLEVENDETIIYTKRTDTDMGLAEVYLIENTSGDETEKTVLIAPEADFESVYSLNPETGAVDPLKYSYTDDGRIAVDLTFGPYGARIVGLE